MFIPTPERHSRSLLKAVSWRIFGSLDTFVISYFVTGHVSAAASIAAVETFTKITLFYFHERLWGIIPWGRQRAPEPRPEPVSHAAPAAPAQPAGDTSDPGELELA